MEKELISFLILLIILGMGSEVLALETAWPASPLGTTLTDASDLTEMVKYFYEWGVFIGGIAAFISLLFGGFLYLTSAGNPSRVSEAKDRMTSAIIGLILLLSIYLILNTINPELTVLTTPEMGPACDVDADCLCKNDPNPGDGNKEGKCGGVGSACDTDTDCPYICSDCLTPPDPNPKCGNGSAEGICMIRVASGCDTDVDCPEPKPDPDPEENYICINDPNPGDGINKGTCAVKCIEVLFCTNSGSCAPGTETFKNGLTDCLDISTTTINSINIRGYCLVSLYKTTNNCPSDPNDIVGPVSQDVTDLKGTYKLDSVSFESIKIEALSF